MVRSDKSRIFKRALHKRSQDPYQDHAVHICCFNKDCAALGALRSWWVLRSLWQQTYCPVTDPRDKTGWWFLTVSIKRCHIMVAKEVECSMIKAFVPVLKYRYSMDCGGNFLPFLFLWGGGGNVMSVPGTIWDTNRERWTYKLNIYCEYKGSFVNGSIR